MTLAPLNRKELKERRLGIQTIGLRLEDRQNKASYRCGYQLGRQRFGKGGAGQKLEQLWCHPAHPGLSRRQHPQQAAQSWLCHSPSVRRAESISDSTSLRFWFVVAEFKEVDHQVRLSEM